MYAPLQLLSQSPHPGEEYEAIQKQYIQLGVKEMDGLSEEEFVSFVLSTNFLNPQYKGKLAHLNTLLFHNTSVVEKINGLSAKQLLEKGYWLDAEWRDILLAPCLFDRWAKSKQVYKPDPDFADALLHTKKLQYTKEIIESLRTDTFYIDLEGCPQFLPVIGAWVFVGKKKGGCTVSLYLLTTEIAYYSHYSNFEYSENNEISLMEDNMPNKKFDIFVPTTGKKGNNKQELSRKEMTFFAMQMICYLASAKPDISEDPVTEKTYRAYSKPRNRFSEVQRHEVGIRYGQTLRTKISDEVERMAKEEAAEEERNPSPAKERKPPCPHFRCAHWHRYWVGEGRKNCEVRWVEPTFVGLGHEARDVVIHKVSK